MLLTGPWYFEKIGTTGDQNATTLQKPPKKGGGGPKLTGNIPTTKDIDGI